MLKNFVKFLCLLCMSICLLFGVGCSNSDDINDAPFVHERVKWVCGDSSEYTLYFQVTNVTEGILTSKQKCVTFEITIENIMPINYAKTSIMLYDFDFYFLDPETIFETILLDSNYDEIYIFELEPGSINKVYFRVIYHELTDFDANENKYVLKLLKLRI